MYLALTILNYLIIFTVIIEEIIFILLFLDNNNKYNLEEKILSKILECLIHWTLKLINKFKIIFFSEEIFIINNFNILISKKNFSKEDLEDKFIMLKNILNYHKNQILNFDLVILKLILKFYSQKNILILNDIPWDLHLLKKNNLKNKNIFFKYNYFLQENNLKNFNTQIISPLHLTHLDFSILIQVAFTVLNSYEDLKKNSLFILNKTQNAYSIEDQIMYIQDTKFFLYNKILLNYNIETYKDLELKLVLKNFFLKWFCSTNHKIIGTLYLIFSGIAGIIGLTYSMMIRIELAVPGASNMFQGDFQLYNVVVTAHALVMIFFFCDASNDRRFW